MFVCNSGPELCDESYEGHSYRGQHYICNAQIGDDLVPDGSMDQSP